MNKNVTYVEARYRLKTQIMYQSIIVDIPPNIPQDDQSIQDHCHNALVVKFPRKIAAFYVWKKRYGKRC